MRTQRYLCNFFSISVHNWILSNSHCNYEKEFLEFLRYCFDFRSYNTYILWNLKNESILYKYDKKLFFCIIEIFFLALICAMDCSSNSFNGLLFQYIYFLRFDKTLTYPTLFTLRDCCARATFVHYFTGWCLMDYVT